MATTMVLHEIGYRDFDKYTPDMMDLIKCGRHFVKYKQPYKRNIVSTAIKEFENFELPVYKFHKLPAPFFSFKRDTWKWAKIDTARGCRITFIDGTTMYVSEMESEISDMIRG